MGQLNAGIIKIEPIKCREFGILFYFYFNTYWKIHLKKLNEMDKTLYIKYHLYLI
jgi:hypothetical protein